MRYLLLLCCIAIAPNIFAQQNAAPCETDSNYHRFDFWIGNWEVFGPKGKAGESHVERILDGCIIFENWTSAKGGYAGKSFNTYNAATQQWQQTWVDNRGGTTEYLRGEASPGKVIFYADKVALAPGKWCLRRLSFFKLNDRTVRQLGERSDDAGKSWTVEYDLEYRRK